MEQRLYALMQQDRWRIGIRGLAWNPSLAGLARGAPHQVCGSGMTIYGRSDDMVQRNYFSHQIPPCGSEIFPAYSAAGVPFNAAGENIGWNVGAGSNSADQMNQDFMNSPGHRANILGDFNSVGVGASMSGSWGPGGGASGAIVYAVLFARVPGVVGPGPPAPPPPPPPVAAAPPPPPPPPPDAAPAPPPPSSDVQAAGTQPFLPQRKPPGALARPMAIAHPVDRSLVVNIAIGFLLTYLLISFTIRLVRASARE